MADDWFIGLLIGVGVILVMALLILILNGAMALVERVNRRWFTWALTAVGCLLIIGGFAGLAATFGFK